MRRPFTEALGSHILSAVFAAFLALLVAYLIVYAPR